MLKLRKRDGRLVDFDANKIIKAIEKAMRSPQGLFVENQASLIATFIEKKLVDQGKKEVSIYQIEDMVYFSLIEENNPQTAKAYESYKAVQSYKRQVNTTDNSILSLISKDNVEVMDENSNKNATIVATQRDLIAGEVSKDISKRKLLPTDILEAHETGVLHIHDLDYLIQPMFNCCIINLEDMLQNGTVINGKKIDSPKSFQVACTVMTQIIAQVASAQYGGQSINGVDRILAPFVRRSFEKYKKLSLEEQLNIYKLAEPDEKLAEEVAWSRTKKEIKDGVQTIQYQINTLMTTNGQSPFVTLFMYFNPNYEYAKEASLITEEILKQRLEGIKNEHGVIVTPAFPKLIYVLDEHNIRPSSPFYYLTELAAKCTTKRMYPDYISAKKMKELYEGNIFSPMGCRAFLPPYYTQDNKAKFDGRFNQGVVTINLPQIALLSINNESLFFEILEKRLALVKKALMLRHNLLKNLKSDVSPIHWQYGALTRLKPQESIAPFLYNGYSTLTIGYIGIYETSLLVTGESHTKPLGKSFALKIMEVLNQKKEEWTAEENIAFAVYGTPAESLTNRFCKIDEKRFGTIKNVTDKGYYTNSYHVDVREPIDAFTKFAFEAEFQKKSTGGMISYIEIPNLNHNIEAILSLLEYMYETVMYGEFNSKSDCCHLCNYTGEILIDDKNEWYCPQCKNKDRNKLTVIRRTCGYLGENFWNEGRTKEIASRVLHL